MSALLKLIFCGKQYVLIILKQILNNFGLFYFTKIKFIQQKCYNRNYGNFVSWEMQTARKNSRNDCKIEKYILGSLSKSAP